MDNYYNSLDLALCLKLKDSIDCVGTMKITRKNVPKEVKDAKFKKGEIVTRHCGSVTIFKLYDKTNVTMI